MKLKSQGGWWACSCQVKRHIKLSSILREVGSCYKCLDWICCFWDPQNQGWLQWIAAWCPWGIWLSRTWTMSPRNQGIPRDSKKFQGIQLFHCFVRTLGTLRGRRGSCGNQTAQLNSRNSSSFTSSRPKEPRRSHMTFSTEFSPCDFECRWGTAHQCWIDVPWFLLLPESSRHRYPMCRCV